MTDAPEKVTAHRLVVEHHGGVVEYNLEHPDCAVTNVQAFDPDEDGHTMEAEAYEHSRYACAVGEEIHNSGFLDALGVTSWGRGLKHVTEHLEPGVYEVTYWYQRHPAGPWGSEEWDAGLNVERVIPGGGESNG